MVEKSSDDVFGSRVPRRVFLGGTAALVGAAVLGDLGGMSTLAKNRHLSAPPFAIGPHQMPEAAYLRPFGDVEVGTCNPFGDQQCNPLGPTPGVPTPGYRGAGAGLSVPGLGIPLGGVGTGSFMINQCGTFGPWNMGGQQSSQFWEMRTLPQAAFHVREQTLGGDRSLTVKTLAVPHDNIAPERRFGSVLPAWNQLSPGEGSYGALFPFGYMDYDTSDLKADVSMKFWSPIVANEDERTSMPVAFFDLQLYNPTSRPLKLSVMLTFPNASPHATGTTRTGLYSRYDHDEVSEIGGVTLGADSPTNTPNAFMSEWTIAAQKGAGQTVSYCTSWNGAGDGSDIYAAFSDPAAGGELPNANIDESLSAGAVAVTLTLPAGRRTAARFALAWDFPQVAHNAQQGRRAVWMRRYTAFLGGQETATNDYIAGSYPFKQGFTIARNQLQRYEQTLADVEAWWKPIAENPDVPTWLRKASLNELYHMVFNGSFWESGLVSNTIPLAAGGPRLGSAIPGTHIYYHMDAGGGGAAQNEVDMDSAGWLGFAKLFRSMELSRVRVLLQMIRQNPIGSGRVIQQTFHNTGPYISQGASFQQFPATMPPQFGAPLPNTNDIGEVFDPRGGDPFRDCPHKLIFRTYALIKLYDDQALLSYGYAPMLKALEYSQFFRPPGSHLPMDPPSGNPPNTMDQVPVDGHGIYNCGLYLLSLQILSTLTPHAAVLGIAEATPQRQAALDEELALAKAEFEDIFWNEDTGRYRFCDGTGGITGRTGQFRGRFKPVLPPDAIWLESFAGQLVAMELGLPDLIDLDRARTHLNNTLDQFLRFRDFNGDIMGAPIVLKPDFGYFGNFDPALRYVEINECIPGIAYSAAAAAVRIGRRTGDDAIVAKGLELGEGVAHQIFGIEQSGYAFASPESWFIDHHETSRFPAYTRTRSVWSLYDAVSPITVKQPAD